MQRESIGSVETRRFDSIQKRSDTCPSRDNPILGGGPFLPSSSVYECVSENFLSTSRHYIFSSTVPSSLPHGLARTHYGRKSHCTGVIHPSLHCCTGLPVSFSMSFYYTYSIFLHCGESFVHCRCALRNDFTFYTVSPPLVARNAAESGTDFNVKTRIDGKGRKI